MPLPINDGVFNFIAKTSNDYMMDAISSKLDRRSFEKKRDRAMVKVLAQPESGVPQLMKNDYQRRANDGLDWLDRNASKEANECSKVYNKYLKENTLREGKEWSNGRYSHRYGKGAPDNDCQETVDRLIDNTVCALTSGAGWANELIGHKGARKEAKKIVDEVEAKGARRHEEKFRKKRDLSNSPPEYRKWCFLS